MECFCRMKMNRDGRGCCTALVLFALCSVGTKPGVVLMGSMLARLFSSLFPFSFPLFFSFPFLSFFLPLVPPHLPPSMPPSPGGRPAEKAAWLLGPAQDSAMSRRHQVRSLALSLTLCQFLSSEHYYRYWGRSLSCLSVAKPTIFLKILA